MAGTDVWNDENLKFLILEKEAHIPDSYLSAVPSVTLRTEDDFEKVPHEGGCYWIWTNEPIAHSLHKRGIPKPFDGGEIIYNGLAKDAIRGRAKHHLMGNPTAGWSGISVDIFLGNTRSHRKKAMSPSGKVPYVNDRPIRTKDQLLQLNLSFSEREFINVSRDEVFHFRNGINVFDDKHKQFTYRIYFITARLQSISYFPFIEKKWRGKSGSPKLCSYISGR